MMKTLVGCLTVACLLSSGFAEDLDAGDVADKCVRTFVMPKRIIWSTAKPDKKYAPRCEVIAAETLLAHKWGQVPESGRVARLINSGNAPGLILDFGKELHGGLQLGMNSRTSRNMKVRLRFGESVAETLTDARYGTRGEGNDHALRDLELTLPVMGTAEYGNTGFRFVRIDLLSSGELALEFVRAIESKRPMARLGSFTSSDARLNRIWDIAVRTVHCCCQNYIWDGIKRDRLVWVGDMHPETMAVLNVFGAAPVVRASLDYKAATTDAKTEWMNGMGPYTLWWVRNLAEWYRFTGDKTYLGRHHAYLADTMNRLVTFVTPSNTFEGVQRPFLDWPTEHNRPAVFAGMQALAEIAFREGAYLADALDDAKLGNTCRAAAEKLLKQPVPSANGAKSAAAMLALGGFRDPKEIFAETVGRNGHDGVSTFYGYYMLEAMSAAGENQRALDTVRDYWGAMLDIGATTFWEDFNLAWTNNCFRIDEMPVVGKKDVHGDYGDFCYRGFRHSLCHGWSAGPAAWCINHILGIRPLEAGCRVVEIRPFLGDLEWAEGGMALPDGQVVTVKLTKNADGSVNVDYKAPSWVKVVVKR